MRALIALIAQPYPSAAFAPGQLSVLRTGTSVARITTTDLDSKANRVGDRRNLEVADDVTLGGQAVIPRGATAAGEVTRVVRKGACSKSGKVDTRLRYALAGGQQIRLSGRSGDRGKSGTAGTVGAAIAVGVFSFLATGSSASSPPDTRMTDYIGGRPAGGAAPDSADAAARRPAGGKRNSAARAGRLAHRAAVMRSRHATQRSAAPSSRAADHSMHSDGGAPHSWQAGEIGRWLAVD